MQEREAASATLGLPGSGGKWSARDAQTSSAANKWLCLIRKPLGNCSHHSPKLPRLNRLPAAGESAHYLRPDCTSSLGVQPKHAALGIGLSCSMQRGGTGRPGETEEVQGLLGGGTLSSPQ